MEVVPMIAPIQFPALGPSALVAEGVDEAMVWIAARCRQVAEAHMALAEKAEGLMGQCLNSRRFRSGLRTFARHNRRAAWQYLEMAHRAEAAQRSGCEDFDMSDTGPV
jgi:hypothetical protein